MLGASCLTCEVIRVFDTTGALIVRLCELRAQRTCAAGPRRPHSCGGDDTIRRDVFLDPLDERTERVELIGGGPARAVIHPRYGEKPDELGGAASIKLI